MRRSHFVLGAALLGSLLSPGLASAATGTLRYDVPARWPGGPRVDRPAVFANVTVNGVPTVASVTGALAWAGAAAAMVDTAASGPRVLVINAAGAAATTTLSLDDGGSTTWSAAATETIDAQISAFIHTERARAYCQAIAPSMTALDQQVQVTVNVDQTCEADSDGTSLSFSLAAGQCENTARIADLVYHQFGHVFHQHAVDLGSGAVDGPLGEGVGDYLAATITGDSAIAPGIHFSAAPLRDIDPVGVEYSWPADVAPGDDTLTGLIISGALWDLRKLLVAGLGSGPGVAKADLLFYGAIQNAVDIPSMFDAILAADDDDGNLSNGTPYDCVIHDAFAPHGLYAPATAGPHAPIAVFNDPAGFDVTLTLLDLSTRCPNEGVAAAELHWVNAPSTSGESVATYDEATATLTGHIPTQPDGSVVLYEFIVTFENGATLTFPTNPVDPRYSLTVQALPPIDAGTDPDGGASDSGAEPDGSLSDSGPNNQTPDGGPSDADQTEGGISGSGGTPGSGGASGSGGAGSGGMSSSGGAGSGGAPGASGNGAGGASTASGGSPSVEAGAGSPDSGASTGSESDSGCGCSVPGRRPDPRRMIFASALTLMLAFRRGRARRRSHSQA